MRTPSVEQLAAREAIREIANRYARGVDHLDAELMRSAYWPDAVDDHGVFVGNAWEFVDRVMASHTRWAWTMHSTTNHAIELGDDGLTATGELYNVSYLQPPDRATLHVWYGRYLDRYERRGDEWRIVHRTCVHLSTEVRPVDATMPIDTDKFRQTSRSQPGTLRDAARRVEPVTPDHGVCLADSVTSDHEEQP